MEPRPAAAAKLSSSSPARLRGAAHAWRRRPPRALLLVAARAVVVAFVVLKGGAIAHPFAAALQRALPAAPAWVAAGLAFEVLSFAGYVALLWHVAGRGSTRFDVRTSYQVTLAGAAATRLLPTGGAGGAALTL